MKNNVVINNGNVSISNSFYKTFRNENHSGKNIDVFSLIGALCENADIFLETDEKKCDKAMLKYMYSQDEILKLLEDNKVKNIDALVEKIHKVKGRADIDEKLKPVVDNLLVMHEYVAQVSHDKDLAIELNAPGRKHTERLRLLKTGTLGLVRNILRINDGPDMINLSVRPRGVASLVLDRSKFPTVKTQIIYNNALQHIKKVYGYSIKPTIKSQPEYTRGKTLHCNLGSDPLTNTANVMYNVSKQLSGSKNISFDAARKFINKNVNDKELEKKFEERKDDISEAVSTLTTMFALRFILNNETYYTVNRQLSLQLCYKMKNLIFSLDGADENDASVKDAWLIKYIRDRVSKNVTAIVTKNGIHNAKDLAAIYNLNGTTISSPSDIVTIDDLVFSKQTNQPAKQKKQVLVNSAGNNTPAIIKDFNFKEIISRIEDKYIQSLVRNPLYNKIYKEEYRKTYAKTLEDLKLGTSTTQEVDENVKKLNQQVVEAQEDVKNLNGATPEETVVAQAQCDAKRDVVDHYQTNETLPEETQTTDEQPTEVVTDDSALHITTEEPQTPTETVVETETPTETVVEEPVAETTEPEVVEPEVVVTETPETIVEEVVEETPQVITEYTITDEQPVEVVDEQPTEVVTDDSALHITTQEPQTPTETVVEEPVAETTEPEVVEPEVIATETPENTTEETTEVTNDAPIVEEDVNSVAVADEIVNDNIVDLSANDVPTHQTEVDQTAQNVSAVVEPEIPMVQGVMQTEPKPKSPEEMYEAIKKSYVSLLKSKNIQDLLNLRSIDTERIQTDKQNIAGRKIKDYMIDEIATSLAERTCVYYAKSCQSKYVTLSNRPRAIISCYCNEILMGRSIFASSWRKSADPLLAVLLANECNSALKELGLEYAVDEDTYAKVNNKYATQIASFKKDLDKFRKKQQKLQDESTSENV